MKKFLLTLCCALLALLPALALADAYGAYVLPDGAELVLLEEADRLEVPQGLEEMYKLMRTANSRSDVFLIRLKNGRALVSLSFTERSAVTPEKLLALWPQVAKAMAHDVMFMDDSEECAKLDKRFGRDALVIDTTLVAGQTAMLRLDAQCTAFYNDEELIEIWTLIPSDTQYLFDEEAQAQRQSDAADMQALLGSFDFDDQGDGEQQQEPSASALPSERYAAPDGWFALDVPKGSWVLNKSTPTREVSERREAMIAARGQDASQLFDLCLKDALNEDAVFIIAPDQSAVLVLYRLYAEEMRGMTVEQLMQMGESNAAGMQNGKFDSATFIEPASMAMLGGMTFAGTEYLLRSGQTDILLNLFGAVDEQSYLYEVDLFTFCEPESQPTQYQLDFTLTVLKSLEFPPVSDQL